MVEKVRMVQVVFKRGTNIISGSFASKRP
ncbi:MAG: hypothetical protein UZ19_OD1000042, partial [Parcubacteria bacterium OLB19]